MRKGWIVFLLSLALVSPQASFAGSDTGSSAELESLAPGFLDQEKNLREVRTETWQLYKALGDNYVALVVFKLEVAEVLCSHEAHLVSSYALIKDSARKDYAAQALAASEMVKKRMKQAVDSIEEMRAYIPYPPVLPLLDEAKTSIESAMGLVDDSIGAFRSLSR